MCELSHIIICTQDLVVLMPLLVGLIPVATTVQPGKQQAIAQNRATFIPMLMVSLQSKPVALAEVDRVRAHCDALLQRKAHRGGPILITFLDVVMSVGQPQRETLRKGTILG